MIACGSVNAASAQNMTLTASTNKLGAGSISTINPQATHAITIAPSVAGKILRAGNA